MSMKPRLSASYTRLLYTSHCAIAGDSAAVTQAVETLAARSAAHNRQVGLTGALLFVEGAFVQVLEGPRRQVEATFERICCDLRHETVRLIDFASVPERLFADWHMALLSDVAPARSDPTAAMSEIRRLVGVNAREAERQILAVLADRGARAAA